MASSSRSRPEQRGDIDAFRRVFEAEFGYVCRVLRRFGVHASDLEDLAQDVFISAYAKFASYDPKRPLRPWLTAFAFYVASNSKRVVRYRREIRDVEVESLVEEQTPESLGVASQGRQRVLRALHTLAFEHRSLLAMHDIDGMSALEIAEILKIPVGTVYSRMHYAREEFRRAFRKLSEGQGEG